MKRLIVAAALVVAACAPASNTSSDGFERIEGSNVYLYHDDERGVTCWAYRGISCVPDSQLTEGSLKESN